MEIQARIEDIFNWIRSGELNVRVDHTFSLGEATEAHRYLEGRQTKGKLLLLLDMKGSQPPLTPSGTIDVEDPVDETGWESFPASDPPPY